MKIIKARLTLEYSDTLTIVEEVRVSMSNALFGTFFDAEAAIRSTLKDAAKAKLEALLSVEILDESSLSDSYSELSILSSRAVNPTEGKPDGVDEGGQQQSGSDSGAVDRPAGGDGSKGNG